MAPGGLGCTRAPTSSYPPSRHPDDLMWRWNPENSHKFAFHSSPLHLSPLKLASESLNSSMPFTQTQGQGMFVGEGVSSEPSVTDTDGGDAGSGELATSSSSALRLLVLVLHDVLNVLLSGYCNSLLVLLLHLSSCASSS